MKCSADFFGLKELPAIDIDKETLEELALKSSSLGLTVPGVQKKLSLHLSDEGSSRLTLVGHPAGYILKPQTEDFEQLPQSEDLVMDIAEMMGVRVVPHGLIEVDNKWAYISKRIDRLNNEFYAMEDFCQLSGRLTLDKYKSSYERCAGIIKRYSVMPGFDMSEFYLRLLVCFVTGNSDMHLKNFSLYRPTEGYQLTPAYDLLNVAIANPKDKEELALTLSGKKTKLRRIDFLNAAKTMGLKENVVLRLITSLHKALPKWQQLIQESFLSEEKKQAYEQLVVSRLDRL